MSEEFQYFTQYKDDYIWDTLNVNIAAATMLTRVVLPGMLRKRRGAIVNVSSLGGSVLIPLGTLYSSSKVILHN